MFVEFMSTEHRIDRIRFSSIYENNWQKTFYKKPLSFLLVMVGFFLPESS
jgi:hypothetical protein